MILHAYVLCGYTTLSVILVGNSCHILPIVQIWSPPISTCLAPLKEFMSGTKYFEWWWSEDHCEQIAKTSTQKVLSTPHPPKKTCFFGVKKLFWMNGDYIEKLNKRFFLGEMWVVILRNSFYLFNDLRIYLSS